MHGLFENIVPSMFRHWSGLFFKDDRDADVSHVLPKYVWAEIGTIMQTNRENMPLDFGRPPIDIQRHYAAFKAEDWANWVLLYSLPLLQSRLPER